MKRTILITGGNGYVGNNIIKNLSTKDFNIRTIIRKNSNASSLKDSVVKIFRGDFYDEDFLDTCLKDVEIVIHCAALIDPSNKEKEEMMKINYEGTKSLINSCIKHKVKKFIYMSSSSVLTTCQDNFKNNKFHESTNFNLNKAFDWYTKSKALATNYVLFCAEKKFINASIIYPTSIIGPNFVKPTATHKMIDLILNNKLKVKIDGGYNFVDIRTVVDATIKAIDKSSNGKGYIISGEFATLEDIMTHISKTCNCKTPKLKIPTWIILPSLKIMEYFDKKNNNPLMSVSAIKTFLQKADFDGSLARKRFDLKPITLEQSLTDTIKYMSPMTKSEQLSILE